MAPDVCAKGNGTPSLRRRIEEWMLALKQTPRVVGLTWRAWPLGTLLLPPLTFVAGILPVLSLYFLKRIIDGVTLWSNGNIQTGRTAVILFAALGFAALILQRVVDQAVQLLQKALESCLRYHVQSQIMLQSVSIDMRFFETPSFYDKLQQAQREVGFRPFSIIMSLIQGARELFTLAGSLVVIMTLAWWLLPYLLFASLPLLIVQERFGRQGWVIVSGRTPEERLMWYIHGLLTTNRDIKEVRLFGLGEHLANRWKALFWKFCRQDMHLAAKRALAELGATFVGTLAYAGFYAFAIYCTLTRPWVTIGSLIMYTQAMERATGSVLSIMRSVAGFYENNLYLSNLFEYLSQKPGIVVPSTPVAIPQPIRHGIRFEDVTFRYPNAFEDALRNVSLTIAAGQRVALVGENGAGKTTLIKLLARLYDPQSGRITVDGIDLREFDPSAWQRQLGVIFQDFARFSMTARENVGFGRLEHLEDLRRIRDAAELSGAREPIERLEKKWETVLSKMFDDGCELSVGEWQKVALARAFLRDAPVLVLDEPTASLDAKQEHEILRRFNELTAGKTTILVSHRFSSVRMAETIFVIERGHLVEHGSHEDLLAVNNRYAEMFNRQAEAYR